MVDQGNDHSFAITLTVASGASVSDEVEFRGLRPVSCLVPITTTNTVIIQFWAGFNGSTPVVMKDIKGTEVEATVAAAAASFVPLEWAVASSGVVRAFAGVNTMQIKLFQTNGTTAQAQGAERLFTFICQEQ